MFTSLLGFEILYQIKQRLFIGFSFLFLFFGIVTGSRSYTMAKVAINSAYQISYNTALFSLGCVFAIMFFAISGMLRDRQYKIESILYSTSIKKHQFFFSRFLGILVFSLLAFSFTLIGFALGNLMPGVDPEKLAAFNLVHYFWTWCIFVLPNVFICTAIIFAVCTLSKNNIATYISAVSIYALYMLCAVFLNSPLLANAIPPSPENLVLASLADPFGLSAFFEQTQFWTPFQKNNQLVSFSGYFMWNRIIWISISTLILAATYKLFSFRNINQKIKKTETAIFEKIEIKSYQPVSTVTNIKTQYYSFLSSLKIELINVFKSLPFLALMLIWIVIVFTEIYSRINQGGGYNDSLYPTSNLMIWLINDPFDFVSLILIVFYSGELIWRERNINFSNIIDATPTSNTVFFLSKFLTLLLLPAILIGTSVLMAIGFQIAKGYYQFEFGQYLSMFYYSGIWITFFILVALFIQSLVNNKYLGMVIMGLIFIFFGSPIAADFGFQHPLVQIGNFPQMVYTNMTGYGDYAKPFHHYAVYWISLGTILSLLSFKLWRRGTIHKFSFRLKQVFSNWGKWQLTAIAILGILFIASGSTIFYNTNILNEFLTVEDQLDYRESYERKYKKYDSLERLYPVNMKTAVDIYPDEGKFIIKSDYLLENKSDTLIKQVLISARESIKNLSLENATLIEEDTFFDTYLFKLNEPLLPGQQLKYAYEVIKEKTGFETSTTIVKNGSYILHTSFEPILGYRSSREIKNNFERKKRGLPALKKETPQEDHLHQHEASIGKLFFETIVSTQANQTAIAPGKLIKQWTANDRNFYHYKTDKEVTPLLGYFSANYKTQKSVHRGISIEQYYHPSHDYNIDNIENSAKQALDYCIENFGEYPMDHLRIAEIPSHWGFGGQAMPGTISMVEDKLYLLDNRNPEHFDLVAKRTIHEVAHQWWGGVFLPKMTDGATFFLEGLAKYTEAVVMENTHGKRAIWQLSETSNRRYFQGRTYDSEPEPPLYFNDGQDYLAYGKSYTVMLAMKELIGEAQVNTAIRNVLNKHKDDIELSAITLELLDEFYLVSPKKYHILIDDWFKRIITYDLKVDQASYKKLADGNYEVTVNVSSKRFKTIDTGEAIDISIDEPIQIGLLKEHPESIDETDPILYLKAHQINQEKMQFKVIVNEIPLYISIDPFGTRLDANRVDNLIRL